MGRVLNMNRLHQDSCLVLAVVNHWPSDPLVLASSSHPRTCFQQLADNGLRRSAACPVRVNEASSAASDRLARRKYDRLRRRRRSPELHGGGRRPQAPPRRPLLPRRHRRARYGYLTNTKVKFLMVRTDLDVKDADARNFFQEVPRGVRRRGVEPLPRPREEDDCLEKLRRKSEHHREILWFRDGRLNHHCVRTTCDHLVFVASALGYCCIRDPSTLQGILRYTATL